MVKKTGTKPASLKLTYATMFDPPSELYKRYDHALKDVRNVLVQEHAMFIGGKDVRSPLSAALHA
jgi:1-pyrroline-5-carboxylate dehydrogenase